MSNEISARSLGLTSLAIGITELAAPEKVEEIMGLPKGQHTGTLRVLGVRECLHGVDLLLHRNARPGVLARVAGDALDGILLGAAATKTRKPASFAAVTAMVMGVVALDFLFAKRATVGKRNHRLSFN